MASTLSSIPFLFDRPGEPLITGRDEVTFDIPVDYLPDRLKPLATAIQTRYPSTSRPIPVQNVTIPDITQATLLNRRANFSLFNPFHQRCAKRLIEVFMSMPNADQFLSACVFARDKVNPYLFVYASSVAIIHRPDTRSIRLPTHCETFPELYMDSAVFARAKEEVGVIPDGSRIPIEIPLDYTASNLDEEHRVAYWREDVGVNLHHWHWHLVYPFDGPLNIVQKDRRGELFYYMHQQIMARYNFERLSNNLARVKRLANFHTPLLAGYFPKLDSLVASRTWPSRQPHSVLSDLNRETDQLRVDIQDLERWRDRIFEVIHSGSYNNGQTNVQLTEETGIDILGNMIEASILAPNRNRYGNLHNFLHLVVAFVHDPDGRYLESFGVMGDPTTAMRDPIFYNLHAFIDDMFQEYKNTLPPYTFQQLTFDNVGVTSVEVAAEGIRRNEFSTFWQQDDIDLSRGLDFAPRGPVFARITHLQHAPFTYRIQVNNSGAQRVGTVRIFMSPKFDERGSPYLFRDQRGLFVELDKFTFNLRPGNNLIERRSTQSSVTIPFEQTFRSLNNQPADGVERENFNYCGCGWPQHLLVARGNGEGLPCELFVMISDARNDTVQQPSGQIGNAGPGCDDAQSYCGVRNGRYPDRRAMGFPFDRAPRTGINTLQQFITSNMLVQDVTIRFSNRIVASANRQGQAQTAVRSSPQPGFANPRQTTPASGRGRTGPKRN